MRRTTRHLELLALVGLATACASTAAKTTPSVATSKIVRVDHVGLTVKDLEVTKTFFLEALDFEVRGQDKAYPAYFLHHDGTNVTLWQASDPATAIGFDRKNNIGLHHLALGVSSFEQLDAYHARLKVYPGVTIEFAPEFLGQGPAKHMMFREPGGNRLELIHRPR